MKAIKIPNATLLDVFGRPVALNSHDPHRPSLSSTVSRAGFTESHKSKAPSDVEHHLINKNPSVVAVATPKLDSDQRLCVIGKFI